MTARRLVAVVVGGVIGTWLRWGVISVLPVDADSFPTSTFLVNMVGSAALGVVVVRFLDRRPVRPVGGAFLGPGLLGGLTTFSAFSVETVELLRTGHGTVAGVYVVASVVLGVFLAWIAMILTRRITFVGRRSGGDIVDGSTP